MGSPSPSSVDGSCHVTGEHLGGNWDMNKLREYGVNHGTLGQASKIIARTQCYDWYKLLLLFKRKHWKCNLLSSKT